MSFSAKLESIDKKLRMDDGINNNLDYLEQSSWILFLKLLEDTEKNRKKTAELNNTEYKEIFEEKYKWSNWAVKKLQNGSIDIRGNLRGDQLIEYIKDELFPYLESFSETAEGKDSLEYKIGAIFNEINLKFQDGNILREVLDSIDEISIGTDENRHELSMLYENRINDMGTSEGRTGGQYYTPRPLIQVIVERVNPQIGETVYDGAVGSAGFLVEAYKYMVEKRESVEDFNKLQKSTFYGNEKKSFGYIVGLMNMILHGIESPNIIRKNTLKENSNNIQPQDQHDVVLANPPFGGSEQIEVQENFTFKTSETAYMFLEHFIKILKNNGRAGIIIKNTFLSNDDAALLRKELLNTCNLELILDLPSKTFPGAGVKTVVLFFKKGSPTKEIQYYQLKLDRNIGKTTPLNLDDLDEFRNLKKDTESKNTWTLNINDINQETFNLDVINPNIEEEVLPEPSEILKEIEKLEKESTELLKELKNLL